jgi:hypothetical protein
MLMKPSAPPQGGTLGCAVLAAVLCAEFIEVPPIFAACVAAILEACLADLPAAS